VKETDEWVYNMKKLTCRFCGEEFEKGWDNKESASGMDRLLMHVRKHHSREWGNIRRYSVGTTSVKEDQLVSIMGAYQHEKNR